MALLYAAFIFMVKSCTQPWHTAWCKSGLGRLTFVIGSVW